METENWKHFLQSLACSAYQDFSAKTADKDPVVQVKNYLIEISIDVIQLEVVAKKVFENEKKSS